MRPDGGAARTEDTSRLDAIVEAAARAASRMAHDLNNLLTAVGGYVEIARSRLPPGHAADEALAEALKATDRASERVRKIHAFARFPDPKPVPLDLGAWTRDRLPSWRSLVDPAPCDVEDAKGPVLALADAYLLEQLVQHVLRNARDAVAGGGAIRLSALRVAAGAVPPLVGGRPVPAARALLVVADDGPGLDDEARAHLFEPFFTTKPRSDHLGLGLATAWRLARRIGAEIRVASSSSGTAVGVLLPVSL